MHVLRHAPGSAPARGSPAWLDPDFPERMRFALPGERHKLARVRESLRDPPRR